MSFLKPFLIILTIIIVLFLGYLGFIIAPTSFSSEEKIFIVPLEANQDEMTKKLKDEGYIRSIPFYQFIAGFIHYPGTIEPGSYKLSHRMSLFKIADTLMLHPYQRWIILVPGLRKEQVAERLAKKFYWQDDKLKEFLETAREGYLFPDTYLLNIDYSGKDFAKRLMNNFNDHLTEKMQNDLLAQNVRVDTAVKIASLIERESGGDEDKALIAGIIWNRLNSGMRLQIDATSQYIKGSSGNWWPNIVPADHQTESDYNTYLNKGLPPGPISNPSLASFKAAIYPQETECLFYLHSSDRQIHCSEDYAGHLRNIDEYLRN